MKIRKTIGIILTISIFTILITPLSATALTTLHDPIGDIKGIKYKPETVVHGGIQDDVNPAKFDLINNINIPEVDIISLEWGVDNHYYIINLTLFSDINVSIINNGELILLCGFYASSNQTIINSGTDKVAGGANLIVYASPHVDNVSLNATAKIIPNPEDASYPNVTIQNCGQIQNNSIIWKIPADDFENISSELQFSEWGSYSLSFYSIQEGEFTSLYWDTINYDYVLDEIWDLLHAINDIPGPNVGVISAVILIGATFVLQNNRNKIKVLRN